MVTQTEYLAKLAERVHAAGLDTGLDNQRRQLRSKSLLQTLAPDAIPSIAYSYDVERLVRNGTFVFQSVARLVEHGFVWTDFSREIRTAAEIFEYLAELGQGPDTASVLLLAAGLYQFAGYQANALCLARSVSMPDLRLPTDAWSATALLLRWMALAFRRRFVALMHETRRFLDDVRSRSSVVVDPSIGSDQHSDSILELSAANLEAHSFLAFARFALRGDLSPAGVRTPISDGIWRRYVALLARGRAENMLDARGAVELWASQRTALDNGLLEPGHPGFVIRMPTSAGKTRIAELAILRHLASGGESTRAIYVAPYCALADEVESSLEETFSDLGFQVSSVLGSFELDEFEDYLLRTTHLLITTPEKLSLLVRNRPDYFQDVGLIVLDEGHIIDDRERGARYEILLTILQDLMPASAQTIFISAVIPDANARQFAEWLCKDKNAVLGRSPFSSPLTHWLKVLTSLSRQSLFTLHHDTKKEREIVMGNQSR